MTLCCLYPMRAAGAFPALILKTQLFEMEPTKRMFNEEDFTHRRPHVNLMSFNNSNGNTQQPSIFPNRMTLTGSDPI